MFGVHKYLFIFSFIFFSVWQFFVVRNSDINDVQQKLNRLAEMFVKYRNIIFFSLIFFRNIRIIEKSLGWTIWSETLYIVMG